MSARVLRTGALLVTSGVAAFVLVLLLASTAPLLVGDRTYVVRSGSMAPAVDTGDVVAIHTIRPTDARVGDIVSFVHRGRFTSHRVRSVVPRGAKLLFTTQGDANTAQERWAVRADGRIGRITYRIPKLGFVVVRIQSTIGRLGLIILPAFLLGGLLLRRIWRTDPDEAPGPGAHPELDQQLARALAR